MFPSSSNFSSSIGLANVVLDGVALKDLMSGPNRDGGFTIWVPNKDILQKRRECPSKGFEAPPMVGSSFLEGVGHIRCTLIHSRSIARGGLTTSYAQRPTVEFQIQQSSQSWQWKVINLVCFFLRGAAPHHLDHGNEKDKVVI